MTIDNLVKSAVFSLAITCGACGDTYNKYGSEESTPATSYSDPARVICKEFLSCCAQAA